MLKNDEWIKILKHIEANRSTFYSNQYPYNCGYIHDNGILSFDCIGLVKSVINEPNIAYKNSPVGYFVKPNQKIPDTTELGILNLCSDISYNFNYIPKGSYLYMSGHAGVFCGEFSDPSGIVNTIECTPAFGGGVVTSYTDASGRRWNHKGGYQIARWEAHGKLSRYIDYADEPKPQPSKKITEDGEWGYSTTKLAQQVFRTEVDGEVSCQDTDCRKYCLNCVAKGLPYGSWEWNDSKGYSPLIRAIQIWCGLPSKDQDGKFGYSTIKALQRKLKVVEDGYCGYNTVLAFQRYLNSQV